MNGFELIVVGVVLWAITIFVALVTIKFVKNRDDVGCKHVFIPIIGTVFGWVIILIGLILMFIDYLTKH